LPKHYKPGRGEVVYKEVEWVLIIIMYAQYLWTVILSEDSEK